MPDFKNMPRQRGISANPYSETNPRRYARARCDKAMNACDRIVMYMGELIQTYKPDEMLPNEAVKLGQELSQWAIDNNIDFQSLIDISNFDESNSLPIGKFSGYIAMASMIMTLTTDMRNTISELRSTI